MGFGSGGYGATQTLEAASRIDGAGTVLFNGDTVDVEGTYDLGDAGTSQIHAGTVRITGAFASPGKTLSIDGGTLDDSSTAPVAVSELDLSYGTLTGTGAMTVTGTMN